MILEVRRKWGGMSSLDLLGEWIEWKKRLLTVDEKECHMRAGECQRRPLYLRTDAMEVKSVSCRRFLKHVRVRSGGIEADWFFRGGGF